jgi:hypothetical protein
LHNFFHPHVVPGDVAQVNGGLLAKTVVRANNPASSLALVTHALLSSGFAGLAVADGVAAEVDGFYMAHLRCISL